MIERLSHATISVDDQDAAHDFYVGKLGFEVRTDHRMDNGFRWLTVGPKGQKDVEIVLMKPTAGPMFDEEDVEAIHKLARRGKLGAGVFYTRDCRRTYETLKERGVEFMSEPTEQFYGVEATFRDSAGNWYSLTERKQE
jgi:catechol 2,3-dioxygenase-like lactoylglutathione lyase family enzyme